MQLAERQSVTELCAAHPAVKAVAVCDRCGDYHCADCSKDVVGRSFCARCRSLPGVDYLEDTRRRFWGKRDGFVWYFGLLSSLGALGGMSALVRASDWSHVAINAVWLVCSISYLALYRPARSALIAVSGANLLFELALTALSFQTVEAKLGPQTLILGTLGGLLSVLIAIWAYQSPRNRLAFRMPVTEHQLQRLYDRYLSNPFALRAAVYGVVALFVPLANLITLLMGIRALRRADSNAWPPRGGRLPAQIGIAASVLGVVFWGFFGARFVFRFLH